MGVIENYESEMNKKWSKKVAKLRFYSIWIML